jgi:hypothetical protein
MWQYVAFAFQNCQWHVASSAKTKIFFNREIFDQKRYHSTLSCAVMFVAHNKLIAVHNSVAMDC